MHIDITQGYEPGCIGRITQLHADYYAGQSGFGVAFEAVVANELAAFCTSFVPGRDGLWLARGPAIEGSIAIDGSNALDDAAHLRWFITSERVRGHGLGRDLLQRALEFSDQQGYKQVRLWTYSGLDAARHLYELHGFRLHHEGPGSRWGKTVMEQEFVRQAPGRSSQPTPTPTPA